LLSGPAEDFMNKTWTGRVRELGRIVCVGLVGGALAAGCGLEPGGAGEEDVATTYTSFEEFEAATARESETGYYIVDGDTPIYTREELFDFYQQYVAEGELIVRTANAIDVRWKDADKLSLTYCVSTGFGTNYNLVSKAMNDATAAWSHVANVRFVHMTDQDGSCTATNARVLFDVRPITGQAYEARAFSPDAPRDKRNVLIDSSAYSHPNYTLTGLLRHAIGHLLGFRHEYTRPDAGKCFEDLAWRDTTSYDPASVMHSPLCNGTANADWLLTAKDALGAEALYGRRHGAPNLAYKKGASQSSTLLTHNAARAVDGNVDGDLAHNSMSHTNAEASPWWQVDLGSVQPVGEVILHNRIDNGYHTRLGNFKLLVSKDGATWRTINYPSKVGARVAIAVNEANRYVKLQLNADGTMRTLHLGEVEVLASRNLAMGKMATQSSTDYGGDAARAVDGNTNGAFIGNSVTHSNTEVSPFWQVDLGAIQPIGQIVLYNRTDCCGDRLSNFKLMVSNDGADWAVYPYGANSVARLAFDVNRSGRYVKVQLDNVNNTPRYLSLAEVVVLAARNLAIGGDPLQSSDFQFKDGNASKAIDGGTDGDFGSGTSVTHTGDNADLTPWWQVDLRRVMPVGEVVLYNRTDCCGDRLSNFRLQTSNDGTTWTDVRTIIPAVGPFMSIVTNRPARFVRVQLNNIGTPRMLSLAEVEVIAGRNTALGAVATQSSTDGGASILGYPSFAVDGNTDGNFLNSTVTHTSQEAMPYWQVDLGSLLPIGEVLLHNRTDCCWDRLTNFKVQISENGTTWRDFQFPGTASARESFQTGRIGRYVRVQLNGTGTLQLAEVETYFWN
jgi:hypothetical protein